MTAAPPKPAGELAPGLYIVSTPIGNLGDLTFRALEVLTQCDIVLAEDTRVTAKLLSRYNLSKKVERYDDNTDERARPKVLAALAAGKTLALVSDAGTPLISDPGYRLVREAAALGFAVIPVPGASALLAALAVAGLPTDRFLFAGFPPAKASGRRALFEELANVRATLAFYETGPRLADSLADMAAVFGGSREAMVARELTKLYETCIRGTLETLAADPRLAAPRGEIVVLVGTGTDEAPEAGDVDKALADALIRLGPSEAAQEVAKAFGLKKRDLYRRALELKGVS